MTGVPTALLLVLAVLALGTGGLLSAAEAALGRMTRAAAEDLAQEGRRGAGRVQDLAERRGEVTGAVASVRVAVDMLAAVCLTLATTGWIGSWWLVLLTSLALNAVLLGVVTGISPRSYGRRNPDHTLLALGGLVHAVDVVGRPWRWLETRFGHPATPTEAEARAEVTEDLREMIDEIGEADSIEDEDREMLRSVVELGQTLVREVMVPRTDMVTVGHDEPASDALRLLIRSGFSRVPVVGDDTDDVRGVLYLKDVLRRTGAHPDHAELPAHALMREAAFVPETKLADDLLRDMQRGHVHIALAVDEYGGTAGLVTLEDLLEEVVGDLTDEHDRAAAEVEDLGGGTYRVPARLPIDELGALFGLEVEDDDVDSAGGLLTKAIGRVPLPGAVGTIQGMRLEAEEATGRRRQVASLKASRATDTQEGHHG